MAQPVYKLWLFRFTEAWYQLSPEEQQRLLARDEEALAQVGGRSVITCACAWAGEQWQVFGVEEFPDIEAVQQHSQLLAALNWYRYTESMTTLGTVVEPPV